MTSCNEPEFLHEPWLLLDPHDHDQQTLLFWYPAVTQISTDYVRSAVKIEAGAKSALDPDHPAGK